MAGPPLGSTMSKTRRRRRRRGSQRRQNDHRQARTSLHAGEGKDSDNAISTAPGRVLTKKGHPGRWQGWTRRRDRPANRHSGLQRRVVPALQLFAWTCHGCSWRRSIFRSGRRWISRTARGSSLLIASPTEPVRPQREPEISTSSGREVSWCGRFTQTSTSAATLSPALSKRTDDSRRIGGTVSSMILTKPAAEPFRRTLPSSCRVRSRSEAVRSTHPQSGHSVEGRWTTVASPIKRPSQR